MLYNLLDVDIHYKLMRKLYTQDHVEITEIQKKTLKKKLKERYFRFVYRCSGFYKFELFISNNIDNMIIGLKAL